MLCTSLKRGREKKAQKLTFMAPHSSLQFRYIALSVEIPNAIFFLSSWLPKRRGISTIETTELLHIVCYFEFQMLSFMQAYNTFFHQGTDLTSDLEPVLKRLGDDLVRMRVENARLEKCMEERHSAVADSEALTACPMQGYLFKRTSNAFKTWHRRWFLVQDHQLVYRKRTGWYLFLIITYN